jgi:hypothetical protein
MMTNHRERKVRPITGPIRKEKKPRPAVSPYQLQKLATLRYNYAEIPEEHRELVQRAALDILAHGEKLKQNIITIGKRLLEVKEIMPGKFTAWFTEEFNLSDRMAQNMMNVAREYGERPETVSGLSDSVLYVLAAPSTPPEVRLEIETHFKETGKAPSRTEVKRAVKARKPRPEVVIEPEPEPEIETLPIESKRLADAGFTLQRYGQQYRYAWQRGDTTSYSALMPHRADVFDAAFAALGQGQEPADTDQITLTLTRSLVRKLQSGALRNQRFWETFSSEELDRLNIMFSHALKQED